LENDLDENFLKNVNSRLRKIGCFAPHILMGYLDNNIGCAIATAILDDFREDGLIGLYTTKEEHGGIGARYLAEKMDRGSKIIVFDVMNLIGKMAIGKGPVLRRRLSDEKLSHKLESISKNHNIPLQTSDVVTFSDAFVYRRRGFKTLYYPVPVDIGIHTPYGIANFDDVYNAYLLTHRLVEYIK
jgi:putative aminopeptidase FrvX